MRREEQIRQYYYTLYSVWGRQHWWPAQSRFEVIVGAYLTQNTSWSNVEKALNNLRQARKLNLRGIRELTLPTLERLIRSAGYFRQKARRLKIFVQFLDQTYGGSLQRLFAQPTAQVRQQLLDLEGVGSETADAILLYAGNHPVFVVDAYTRRVLERHGLASAKTGYEDIRELFEQALASINGGEAKRADIARAAREWRAGLSHPPSRISSGSRPPLVQVFNEMHGLIVGVGKNYCLKSQKRCEQCPLQKFLPE